MHFILATDVSAKPSLTKRESYEKQNSEFQNSLDPLHELHKFRTYQSSRQTHAGMSAKGATCFFHHRSACMSVWNTLRPVSLQCRTHAYSPHDCRRRAQRVSFITGQHVRQSGTLSDQSVFNAELTHTPHTNVGEGRNVFLSSQVSMYVSLEHFPTNQSPMQNSRILPTHMSECRVL